MSPNSSSRIVPKSSSCAFEEEDVVDFSGERGSNQYPATKAWMSESIPPTIDEFVDDDDNDDDDDLPAVANVHYYRQRQHHEDHSAIVSWLTGLLCIPRTNSWRFGSAPGREESVDSVDFVSTWQKAQAEAASRPVVPALKRPNDIASVPNTPESPVRAPGELPAREPSIIMPSRAISLRGQFNATCIESRNGRSISFLAQRPPSMCRMLPSPQPSGDMEQEFLDDAVADSADHAESKEAVSCPIRPLSMTGLQSASISQRPQSIAGCQSTSINQRPMSMVGQQSTSISQRPMSMVGQQCTSVNNRVDGRQDSRTASRPGSRTDSRGGSRPGSKRSVRFN